VRLAKADEEVATEFFAATDLLIELPSHLRSRLFRVIANTSSLFGGETLREGFRAAMAIASGTTDYELGARVMDVGIHFGRRSFGYASAFLQSVAEIIPASYDGNPFQRALLLHSLDVAEKLSAKFAVDLFDAMSPFMKAAQSEGPTAKTTPLCHRLLQTTEELIPQDDESALLFLLCGLEFIPLSEAVLIERWIMLCRRFVDAELRRLGEPGLIENWTALCRQFGDGEGSQLTRSETNEADATRELAFDLSKKLAWRAGRPFVVFTKSALEPTKALVAAAQRSGRRVDLFCGTVLDSAMEVLQGDAMAAVNCYRSSPSLLGSMSLETYCAWVKRGLDAFSDPARLAAYFAAESRASQEAINESADTLQLQAVAPVLSSYVRMLTGRELPLEPRTEKYDVLEPAFGESIVLPPSITGLKSNEERFHLYKALAAQASGQIEFGTYESGSDRLQSLGAQLIERFPRFPSPTVNGNTDWHTLINIFPQTTVARRLFTILENARIEFLLGQKYKGLRPDLAFARSERHRTKPADQYVMKYEPLLEQLFIEALGDRESITSSQGEFKCTEENNEWLVKVREVLGTHIYKHPSTVADTIRSCLALYNYLNPAPPESSMPWEDPNVKPDHRDRQTPQREEEHQARESSGELSGKSKETEPGTAPAPETEPVAAAHGQPEPDAKELGQLSPDEIEARNTYDYDEWDCNIGDYRTKWCRVVESDWRAGNLIFANRTRAAYQGVLSQVRYQFQLMRPVGLRRVRGQTDGDEFDLEALIDRVIDRRAHLTPSERIYSARQHRERDVAVCFLIDMSASTNVKITRDKRVLDIEKEALLLMSEALEAVGDPYAIYGFSSTRRRRTNVYRFKDFGERYGEQVERRIGNAYALTDTRLGVAIRHATFRLNQQPSATRLLIILSDARPGDENYGDRYAREDTRVALAEARASEVTPFFITFDQGEHEAEMEEMLESTNFTIIDDVQTLPERMPGIYRRLTT
jgi:hypothetical protein